MMTESAMPLQLLAGDSMEHGQCPWSIGASTPTRERWRELWCWVRAQSTHGYSSFKFQMETLKGKYGYLVSLHRDCRGTMRFWNPWETGRLMRDRGSESMGT